MAAKIKRLFYNFILVSVLAVLTVLTILGCTGVTVLSLDQEVRCGLPEHTHTGDCYLDGVLLCKEKAHAHSTNCYLVLLKDNDINWLLQTMQSNEEKSLEGVLDSAMGQALVLNESLTDEPPLDLTGQDISELNNTITKNNIEPAVVLNENLTVGSTLQYTPSAYAVGDRPSTDTRAVNFYIRLNGSYVLVGSSKLTNSNPDYISYSNVVNLYKDEVITELATNNIGRTYFFRYNTNGSTTNFGTAASYGSNSRLGMSNVSSVRYAVLCSGSQYSNTPVDFYTVTLDYSRVEPDWDSQTVYVQSGQSSGLTLSDEYLWYDENGNLVNQLPSTITVAKTYYASPKAYTIKFEDQSGNQISGNQTGLPVDGALTVQMPSLKGSVREGWYWIIKGGDGTPYYASDGTAQVTVTGDTTFQAVPPTYTFTLIDDTGQSTAQNVGYMESYTLPQLPPGYYWITDDGSKYVSGYTFQEVKRDWKLTAAESVFSVNYNVNFPSAASSSVDEVPKLYGTTVTTLSERAIGGKPMILRDLTSRTARREINSGNKESVTYYFKGWTVTGTELLLQPDATISWATLENLVQNEKVTFTGVWEEGNRYNSVSFFVRFDSAAVDTNGNITSQPSENYTPEVFNTYLGGVDRSWSDTQIKNTYEIADTTADNSYTADQNIRALYGEKVNGVWMYDFPADEYVFAYLKDYLAKNPGKKLTYEGQPVDPNQLNHDYYAIRWYVFKLEGSTWHVDGKVYKKEGSITVDKLFGGDETVLQTEKDGFYILAENGTLDAEGNFQKFSSGDSKFKEYLLVVNQNGAVALKNKYPNATILIFDTETGNAHNYEWVIEGVELGEYWHIEEFPVHIPGYSCYAEYSVYDTDGEHTAIAEYGTRASMIGKTFALDEDPDQGLMADFRNYYYPNETILIKKEDAKTGRPIGGAVFELWQNGNRLTFNYNENTGQYERDEGGNGTFTQIVTASDGFSVISTTGFSYDYGDVVVKEVLPPSGYDPAPDITVGKGDDGTVILKDIAGKPPDDWADIARVPSSDVLVVKDHAAEFISVTVEKLWNTNTPADSVEVVLQANGQHAAALFPGMANAQVQLSAANRWTATWHDLPRYANGQVVQWSVKEILVGGKPTLSDGVTFANWIVTYAPGVGTDSDGDGDVDNWKFTVTNTTRRLQLILTKVGTDGLVLPGAIFSLEQVELVNGVWQPVAGVAANIQTTGAGGILTFDNLLPDVYYRLTEQQAAEGYFIVMDPVVLTMDSEGYIKRLLDDGTLAQIYDPMVQITGPYNIRVVNIKMTALPETGGAGTNVYISSGLMLMISAVAMLLYKQKRKKEEQDIS